MEEFSKEELIFINNILIKARNHEETTDFDIEKLMLDNLGSSDQKYYDQILRKIEDAIKRMEIPD